MSGPDPAGVHRIPPRRFTTTPRPGRLDDLPRHAAAAWPHRPAVRDGLRALTFGELDAEVDEFARALRGVLAGDGAVVGSTTALSTRFAALYYGIARSGNVMVSVNPFLLEDGLVHVLRGTRCRLLFVTARQYQALERVRPQLEDLEHVVLLDDLAGRPGAVTLADFLASGVGVDLPEPTAGPDDPAGLHFTSGTTGPPKAVVLSHRNLTVNAAQIAEAHRLTESSVTLNHLPLYHLMHLNSAVHAGASQVLYPADDPAGSIDAANRHRATRYFSLPVRLARLAADPALDGLRLDTVEAIYSGGAALPVAAAERLAAHFGIPVLQGYGLAETSPVTHTGRIDDPRPASVGPAVAETECRIVDVETRAELPIGELGEIQVRGPQVMSGYLDPALPSGIDPDGWLSTGDVGRLDQDGHLYLVDRLKDVFKSDHWLVSPAQIETVVARHPAVADCAVVDHPDGLGSAVPHAFVVLRDGGGRQVLDEITAFVNGRLPYYEHLHHITEIDAVPRSANGKLQRRDLRARAAAQSRPADPAVPSPTASRRTEMVTLINHLTVTGSPEDFQAVCARPKPKAGPIYPRR